MPDSARRTPADLLMTEFESLTEEEQDFVRRRADVIFRVQTKFDREFALIEAMQEWHDGRLMVHTPEELLLARIFGNDINDSKYREMQQRRIEAGPPPKREPEELARSFDELLALHYTEQEQAILRFRFGLDQGGPRSLAETAEEFDLSADEVAEIERAALSRVRGHEVERAYDD